MPSCIGAQGRVSLKNDGAQAALSQCEERQPSAIVGSVRAPWSDLEGPERPPAIADSRIQRDGGPAKVLRWQQIFRVVWWFSGGSRRRDRGNKGEL